jgi:hypothetical protein
MKKWSSALIVAVMLTAATLACGFPLPAGTETMSVTKTVCAESEVADTCQARQDAYQMMAQIQTVTVPDLQMTMNIVGGGEESDTSIQISGSYEYAVADTNDGLGVNVHVVIESGTMTDATGTEELSGAEFIVIGNQGYSREADGEWKVEELTQDTLVGLGLILGIAGPSGAGIDLYSDPAIFTVTAGEAAEYEGQTMNVQTLSLDLANLFGSPEALTALLSSGTEAGSGFGMSEEELGLDEMTPEDMAMMSAFLLPMMAGTEANTTLYIGADDGYVHYVEDMFTFNMDMSMFDETAGTMNMSYTLSGHMTNHNQPVEITAPEGATEGPGIFSEDGGLFGGTGDLGGELFGG